MIHNQLLEQEAHRREKLGDWEGAELLYRQVLSLAKAQDHIGILFTAHHHLSRLAYLAPGLK